MKPLSTRMALGNVDDLTKPTSTQNYKLGFEVTVEDSDYKTVKKFIYVKSHAALTAYVPYALNFTSTAGSEVITSAPVAISAQIGVPQVSFTSGYYGFIQTMGDCLANHAAATTDTYALKISAAAPTVFTAESNATVTVNSFAVAKETGGAGKHIWLFGEQAVVTA